MIPIERPFMKAINIFFIKILYKFSHLISRIHDIILGVDFEIRVDEWDGHRFPYESTTFLSYRNLKKYIKQLAMPERSCATLKILDVGCGKGKMLYVFSDIAKSLNKDSSTIISAVSGLEYRKSLVKIAESNMKILRQRLFVPVNVIYGDAETYNDYDDYNLFYLYNPFDEAIMKKFICNICISVRNRPRKVRIVYCNPYFEDILLEAGFRFESGFFYHTKTYVFN